MSQQNTVAKANRRSAFTMVVVVVAMFGFGYLLVPIYNVVCDVFGLNGKTSNTVAEAPLVIDESRTVKVMFTTTLNGYMPWEFAPEVKHIMVHPGEMTTVQFHVRNKTPHDMVGQAVPSVAPAKAADHFRKTECFCFTQQPLKAEENKDMALRFYIDPALPKDVHTVTLSYTFFDNTQQAALSPGL
ncbi:MAG: cytochrome c oxidase assembly protein [Gammaproteobacteria bacterium]